MSEASEHRISAIERIDDGFVIVCACGWRSRLLPGPDDVGYTWAQHYSSQTFSAIPPGAMTPAP